MISLNLSILILIQVFEELHINKSNPIDALKEKAEIFEKIWIKFTKKNNGVKIHNSEFLNFFKELNQYLGIIL